MTAGGENQEGKLSAAAEDTRQQFIRKQLSHLQHIKDVTQGKKSYIFSCQVRAHYGANKQNFLKQSGVIQSEN